MFTAGVDPGDPGPGAIFVSLSAAFGDLSLGWLAGTVFFGTVIIAALSSAISLTEVVVSYAVDEHDMSRFRATAFVCGALFVLGLAPAYDIILLSLYDGLMNGVLLILGALLIAVYVSWFWSDPAVEELQKGIGDIGSLGPAWIWMVRVPVIIVLVVSLWLGIVDYVDFLTGDFADWLGDL
jgi:NSS family neurotransmitter:Na+ symporter